MKKGQALPLAQCLGPQRPDRLIVYPGKLYDLSRSAHGFSL